MVWMRMFWSCRRAVPYDAASMALHGATWPCYLKEQYLDEVRAVRGVATAAPVFMEAIYDRQGKQSVYLGVETNMLALRPGWKIEGKFPETDGDLLVGAQVAKHNGWRVAEQVSLPGLKEQRGKVAGILKPVHSPDD